MVAKRRALVVGSVTEPLEGPEVDAKGMAEVLAKFDFDVDLRIGQDATRDGILTGYRRLIDATEDGDAALFYYSGHGGFAKNPDYKPGSKLPPYFQCIIPVDIEVTTKTDFRGILAQELSSLLARLTRKTKNVTVVLDCCHAAQMSRDPLVRPKAFPHLLSVGIAPHLERLIARKDELLFDPLAPEENQEAVRLVAAAVHEQAVERWGAGDSFVGVLTESLRMVLDEVLAAPGLELTWEEIGNRVRERVLAIQPTQRPDVEGPRERLLFQVEKRERTGVLAVVPQKGQSVLLRGGRLLGLHEGDEYAILPAGVAAFRKEDCIATARVVQVRPGDSVANVRYREPHTEIPPGALAFPRASAARRRPIRIEAPEAERSEIAKAIARTPLLRVADVASAKDGAPPDREGGAPPNDGEPLLAAVRVADGRIELRNPAGALAVPVVPYSEQAVTDLATNLWRMSVAQGLRELASRPSEKLPESALEVEWGRVEDGQPVPLHPSDEVIPVGTRIYVKMRNTQPDKAFYVWVFGIDAAQKIELLTHAEAGIRLASDITLEYVLGRSTLTQALVGQQVSWPDDLPNDEIRPENLVVLAAEKQLNLQVMESPGLVMRDAGAGTSPLEELLQHTQGTTRGVRTEKKPEGYLVRHIDYNLCPNEATFFLIDDRPPASVLALRPRGLDQPARAPRALAQPAPPRKLALLITELVVHDTLALFGSADVRVDAIAVTRVPERARTPYQAATRQFQRIKDGERLPLDDVLIYHGDARDFLDLRVWVSRDRQDSMELADMLQQRAGSKEFQTAATTLLALTAAAPQAAVVVAGAAAAATLGKIAWELLSKALPKTIGVYQTSLLAVDGFKVGRHPAKGLFRAQGFSFGYEVKVVE